MGPYGERGGEAGGCGLGTPVNDSPTEPHPFPPTDWLAPGRTTRARDCLTAPGKELDGKGRKQRPDLACDPTGLRPSAHGQKPKSHLPGSTGAQAPSLPRPSALPMAGALPTAAPLFSPGPQAGTLCWRHHTSIQRGGDRRGAGADSWQHFKYLPRSSLIFYNSPVRWTGQI